jgi:hypothetical protein
MAKGRPSFERRAREKARKEKADAKRARRHARSSDKDEDEVELEVGPPPGADRDNAAVQDQLAVLHQRYDDGQLSLDDFTEQRDELLSRIHID